MIILGHIGISATLVAQVEAGFVNKSWADAFFVSASYSKTDKELQTGSVQNKVYGMAERNSDSWKDVYKRQS